MKWTGISSIVPTFTEPEKESAPVTRLSVNLNKVAYLRNTRNIGIPSVLRAAEICLENGVGGITVHPRPDRRHIRPSDVHDLSALLKGNKGVEFNIEGNPFPEFMELVCRVRPDQCTLVPDDPQQSTSDHGWDLDRDVERLVPIIAELHSHGIRTSLFMDADPEQIAQTPKTGCNRIELYTEPYAAAFAKGAPEAVWDRFAECARIAQGLGLGVNAGHDLNLSNLAKFLEIPGILEVSIGHALIAEALEMGLAKTVAEYVRLCQAATPL